MTDDRLELLKQSDIRDKFHRQVTGPWTTVYDSWRDDDSNGAIFSAFAPKTYRQKALSNSSWDLSIGDGLPGFMQYYAGGRTRNKYLRYGNDDGLEPLVLIQEHYGMKPRQLPQLCEEFRLFHNLWADPRGAHLIKVDLDGSEYVAAEITERSVRVRTNLLRQYQAARQLDLLVFIDSVRYVDGIDKASDLDTLSEERAESDAYTVLAASQFPGDERPFSRFLAKRVFVPPPRHKAGVWPYDEPPETYPDFIIGEDDTGTPIRHICNPNKLANYFGANPESPHYLTPVFFRREVLQRYFEHPEKYSVEDGYLRCGSLWGVQIDNNHPDHVMVFLGDLGRDLPSSERDYWRTFNIPPVGSMSLTNFRRSFLGQFADAQAPDLIFKSDYERFRAAWAKTMGWDLFRQLEADDEHVFQRLRVPLTDSQPEFEAQVLGLTKLLVDYLNDKQLVSLLGTKVPDEKSIAKLERWLTQEGYPHLERDIAFLRQLQRLRSKMAAHRKPSDYRKFLQQEIGEADVMTAVTELIRSASLMLRDLAAHFKIADA